MRAPVKLVVVTRNRKGHLTYRSGEAPRRFGAVDGAHKEFDFETGTCISHAFGLNMEGFFGLSLGLQVFASCGPQQDQACESL